MPAAETARAALLARAAGVAADAEQAGMFDGLDIAADQLALPGCDLRGASFRGADLSGADLTAADLSKATCSGLRLAGARLEQAKLVGADLIGADLSHAEAGEADFSEALLEDARCVGAKLRFARFSGAVMDGADLSEADLWGATLDDATGERAVLRAARLDEAKLQRADLSGADFTGAILRRADLRGAVLRGAVLREAMLDGADLTGADLSGAVLPYVVLSGCTLRHIRVAGAWLERTRLRADQLGGAIGEEVAGEYAAAREGYIELEQNFRTLGSGEDARWAFLRRRRMGRRAQAQAARAFWKHGSRVAALRHLVGWGMDVFTEELCDYGESVPRVLRAFFVVLLSFALLYWATGALMPRPSAWNTGKGGMTVLNYVLFSLDSMTTVGTGDVALQPRSELGVFLSSLETVLGTVLIGLFGFVLGARMRN